MKSKGRQQNAFEFADLSSVVYLLQWPGGIRTGWARTFVGLGYVLLLSP